MLHPDVPNHLQNGLKIIRKFIYFSEILVYNKSNQTWFVTV